MTISFGDFKKRVASAINQTDASGNFIPMFALSSEVLRYTNDGLREKVELLAIKMKYLYLQYGTIDVTNAQPYYRIDTGDEAGDRYLLSLVYMKFSADGSYLPATMVTLDDIESGRLTGTQESPLWAYALIDTGTGVNHLGIKVSPEPIDDITSGIKIGYPEYHNAIVSDGDLIYFISQTELEWLTYYVALKCAIKSKDSDSYTVLEREFAKKEGLMVSQLAPRALTGNQPIRSIRMSSRSVLKSRGLM